MKSDIARIYPLILIDEIKQEMVKDKWIVYIN